ncbi:MAG: heme exporter protein CcmB [Deferribacterales bacterium]|nr:heme exporter protein CcmB [Deferribacterales bacterium]
MNYFKSIYAIVRKDIIMELRSKEVVNSMLVFALLVTVVFSFIFEPGSESKQEVVGGIFWVAVVFSGLLGLGKSMVSEVQGGNLEALLLSPVDRSAVFFGKFLSNFIFLLFMEAVLLPLFTVFYGINIVVHPKVVLIIFLATYGFCLLGTLFSLISVRTKTREIMLPLMLLPIMVPVILGAILSVNVFIMGNPPEEASNWITLIASFDAIFTAVIFALFGLIIEE